MTARPAAWAPGVLDHVEAQLVAADNPDAQTITAVAGNVLRREAQRLGPGGGWDQLANSEQAYKADAVDPSDPTRIYVVDIDWNAGQVPPLNLLVSLWAADSDHPQGVVVILDAQL